MPQVLRNVNKVQAVNLISDEHLACRAGRHRWPILIPNRPLPQGINAARQSDGCFQITETCETCGEQRQRTTLPRGKYNQNTHWRYVYPEDWVRLPLELEVSRGDLVAELYNRLSPVLFGENGKKGKQS